MALKLRRGTDAERQTITPAAGELIYTTDLKEIWVGDGTTQGGILVSAEVSDDASPQLGGNLDLNGNDITGTGNININGTITATGTVNLGDGAEDNVIVGGQIGSSLIPRVDESYDLGSASNRWRNIYSSGGVIDGSLDVGSLVLDGSIIKSDSTAIYDASSATVNIDILNVDTVNSTTLVATNLIAPDSTVVYDANTDSITIGDITVGYSATIGNTELLSTTIIGENAFILGNADSPATLISYVPDSSSDAVSYVGIADSLDFAFKASNGTLTSPTLINDEQVLVDLKAYGWTGHSDTNHPLGWGAAGSITIETLSGSTINANDLYIPGSLNFTVYNDNTGSDTTAMALEDNLFLTTCPVQAGGYIQFGSYDASGRGALTPAAGMVIWNSDTSQFEGFDGTNWINLVDGTTSP